MLHINFSPLNNITSHKTIVYPVAPGELWVVDLSGDLSIYSIGTNELLEPAADNQGLYLRVQHGMDTAFRHKMELYDIAHLMISCPNMQEEAPDCSNKLYIYDFFKGTGSVLNNHLADKCCWNSYFTRPPYLVKSMRQALDLYIDEDELLLFGRSKFPRPTLVRAFESDAPVYKLMDPYLQWSPPRFWYQADRMTSIPSNLEGWIEGIVQSFNWDYFYHLARHEGHPLATNEHLIATLFELIYDEYLYYGVCKRLFMSNGQVDPTPQLLGGRSKQVLVNFTDIVNSIREIINQKLRDHAPDMLESDPVGKVEDSTLPDISKIFDNMELNS